MCYGTDGDHMEDGGWLVGTSELQLQLQDSGKIHPIRIDILPHDTIYSVHVSSLQYCSKGVCDMRWCVGRASVLSIYLM